MVAVATPKIDQYLSWRFLIYHSEGYLRTKIPQMRYSRFELRASLNIQDEVPG